MNVDEVHGRMNSSTEGVMSFSDVSSIIAVVVTRNRRELLCRCLNGIASQTEPVSRVIVVDNASTDDSLKYVHMRGLFERLTIEWLRLETNVGGAGGFYEGMKKALDIGGGYIWLMDDDGFPAANCLRILMNEMDEDSFIGPLVVSVTDPKELAFSFRPPGEIQSITSIDNPIVKNKAVIEGAILPFNGVLVAMKVVRRLGLPKKEMFIWGDEVEYAWRLKASGMRIALVTRARFYHPKPFRSGTPMLFERMRFNDTDSALKLYCLVRNSVWNYRTYRGFLGAILVTAKTLWFYIFTQPSLRKLRIALEGVKDGFSDNFTRHDRYLNGEGE